MMGQWAMYQDGWLLSTKVNRAPWQAFGPANPDPLNNQVFQLYDLNKDFTQSDDIAAKNPQKVQEMKRMFVAEAKKYQVFPLDASVAARVVAPRPNITAGRTEFVYTRPMTGLPQGDSPALLDASYTITADIEVPQDGAEGMVLTSGRRFGGYGFYLLKGKPVFLWNLVDLERIKWDDPDGIQSNSTSSTTGLAWVRLSSTISAASVGPAPERSRWTARRSPRKRWSALCR